MYKDIKNLMLLIPLLPVVVQKPAKICRPTKRSQMADAPKKKRTLPVYFMIPRNS